MSFNYINVDRDVSISKLRTLVTASPQMNYVREVDRQAKIKLLSLHLPKVKTAFKSTQSNLYVDHAPQFTEWAGGMDATQVRLDFTDWMRKNCHEFYLKQQLEYFQTKYDHHLSYFEPRLHLGNYINKAGLNQGKWESNYVKRFDAHIDQVFSLFKYDTPIATDLSLVEPGIEDYDELLTKYPNFKVLRTDAVSGYPDYNTQTPQFILDHYYNAAHSDPKGIVTAYSRRHGKSVEVDEYMQEKVKIKVRYVGGDEFDNKVLGTGATEVFQHSKPEVTPYYQPWMEVFAEILAMLLESIRQGRLVITTDQSEFDIRHNKKMTKETGEKWISKMPERLATPTRKVLKAGYDDPLIVLNAFYGMKLGRWVSTSGVSLTPAIETANAAVHRTAFEAQNMSGFSKRFKLTMQFMMSID